MSRSSTVDFPHSSARMLLLERHLAAENAHNLEATLATLAEDAVLVDLALGSTWTGRSGAAAHYRMWWDGFDLTVTGQRLHLADDSAAAETMWLGTHVGPFCGLEPTGRAIELPVAVTIELRYGLIAGERFYWDRALLAEQLGVDPRALRADHSAVRRDSMPVSATAHQSPAHPGFEPASGS